MSTKHILAIAIVIIGLAAAAWFVLNRGSKTETLNLLCWSGYEEPNFVAEFEAKYNVKVNAKTFFSGDGMLALLSESPNTYDVVVVDEDYLQKLFEAGLVAELNASDYDFSEYWEPFKDLSSVTRNDELYGVPVEYGTSVLAYNTNELTLDDVSSYDILWDPKTKGKVGIWDWYLPTMGIVSLSLGHEDPYDITDAQLEEIRRRLLELRPQVAAFHVSPTEIMNGLTIGETWIVPGAGEWLASILAQEGHPIDWHVPDEGGLIWINTLVIPKDAPHPEIAIAYIQWIQSPEGQAGLSQKQAYNANVMNQRAYNLLSAEQRDILRVSSLSDVETMLSKITDRKLPVQQAEEVWQAIWDEFKSGR